LRARHFLLDRFIEEYPFYDASEKERKTRRVEAAGEANLKGAAHIDK